MADVVVAKSSGGGAPAWTRRYPPLCTLGVAVLIALLVLPSSLNLQQPNPSQTLELAPVPPEDDDVPPPADGNLSSLGLGVSAGPQAAGPGGDGPGDDVRLPPPADIAFEGKSPSTKTCVGNPPRQTEDPLSPPCQAHFEGDNFGETYQGVDGETVNILFYIEGNFVYLTRSQGNETTPDQEYFDLGTEPEFDEHVVVRVLRVWQRYFNTRYQTYNRFVRFHVYFSGSDDSPEARRADAIDNIAKVNPFAVISRGQSNNDAYLRVMAERGVLNFGSFLGRPASFFQEFPRMIWGYLPSLEVQARQYATYVCTRIVEPGIVTFGGPNNNGEPRELGLVYTSDPSQKQLRGLKDEVLLQLREQCGVEIPSGNQITFPRSGFVQDNSTPPDYALQGMSALQQNGVTTIVWPGGVETNYSKAAAQLGYTPEWVLLGDGQTESQSVNQYQDQRTWDKRVWVVTNRIKTLPIEESICFQAYREADPEASRTDAGDACQFYDDIRQLFTGIQVAGPRLGPTSVDVGFHAIPAVPSTNPEVPACFYEPDDYTCIKDAAAWWWDGSAQGGGSARPGCYRLAQDGLRYISGQWPEGDAENVKDPEVDACSAYTGNAFIDPNPPSPT